jgi:glycosyltransferase involved in cell wall biosynthesis
VSQKLIASVIIPKFERMSETEVAIRSVLVQPGSEHVELLVVDDASTNAMRPRALRPKDRFIINRENLGAAASRNKGIKAARGEWIFFLDSDDEYVHVNFFSLKKCARDVLYYSNIWFDGKLRLFKGCIEKEQFFKDVIIDSQLICQTSSIFFHSDLGLSFDEDLPCHQDWDLVYCGALRRGIKVLNSENETKYNRADKLSISNSGVIPSSDVWLRKLSQLNVDEADLRLMAFNSFGLNEQCFSLCELIEEIIFLLLKNRITFDRASKVLGKRFLKKLNLF